jgi:endoglucanase
LNHSVSLYSFALNATGGRQTYQTAVPAVGEAYASSSFGDELTIAALFLAWVSNDTSRYQEAQSLYKEYALQTQDAVFNWDSKTPGIYVLFAQVCLAVSQFGDDCKSWQDEVERYLDRIVNKQVGSMTNGGLLWYDGDSNDASLNPALNAAMLMAHYAPIASSDDKRKNYLVRLLNCSPSSCYP